MNKRENHFKRSKIFLAGCLGFILGLSFASYTPPVNAMAVFILFWVLAIASLAFWPRKISLGFLMLTCAVLGYWRYQLTNTPSEVARYYDKNITAVGIVSQEPEIKPMGINLTLKLTNINGQVLGDKILVSVSAWEHFNYGDEVRLECLLAKPEPIEDFAYDRYLARWGIYGTCRAERIVLVAKNKGNPWLATLNKIRQTSDQIIKRHLPNQEANLASAMVLGGKSNLGPEITKAFSASGLTHIIAISGMNITLIVILLFNLLLFLGLRRQVVFWVVVVVITSYVLLIGVPASAVRAGIMGLLGLWAVYLGRLNNLDNVLVATAVITLLFNPLLLRDDVGWQLSFLALAGIIYLYPIGQKFLTSKQSFINFLLDSLALTVAAQLPTWPIIAINFGQISLIAVVANLLAVWIAPALLVVLLIALGLSAIFPWVWWWLPALFGLKYLIDVALLSASFPLVVVQVGSLAPALVVIYYLALMVLVYFALKFKWIKHDKNV